jgi:hypothetical protein
MGEGLRLDIALGSALQGIIPDSRSSAEAFLNIACFQDAPRIMGALGPKPGQAIGLQFNTHLQFIGRALIGAALQPFHFLKHAQFILDMMPNLMRHDIGRSKITGRVQLPQQSAHEIKVNVHALISWAVKGANLRLSRAAA